MASVYRAVPFDELTVELWNAQLDVDLRAAWLCTRAAVPHMRRLRGGRVINIGDWLAKSGRPRYGGYLTYYVAKAGVAALTEAMALELANGSDPRERDRARTDRRAGRHLERNVRRGGAGHAARAVGR